MAARPDPYQTLGIRPTASDAELRAAYRRLVQLHHPDHNNGSPEAARRFEEVQEAYAAVQRLRRSGAGQSGAGRSAPRRSGAEQSGAGRSGPRRSGAEQSGAGPAPDPALDTRLAQMERELKAARDARERAVRQAREAGARAMRDARAATGRQRPSDEELGYFSTDDSLSKIVDDTAAELSEKWSEARRSPVAHRVSDLIDELAAKLTGEHPKRD